MKKLLVAIDGSEASLHAGAIAVQLAAPTRASLVLVYAVPPVIVPPEVPFGISPLNDEGGKAGAAVLERTKLKLGVPEAKTVVLQGPPAESIAELAETEAADMVVVGSKGHGAVTRMLVGSVTDRLVHICRRPVLVVR